MAHFDLSAGDLSARRLIVAGGLAVAAAFAPVLAIPASAAPVASCPAGESEDVYSGSCLPDTVPNSPVNGNASEGPSGVLPSGTGGLPSVDGIPCTANNRGTCIGLQNNEPEFVPPPTSIDGQ